MDERILSVVRVLVLIDQDVTELLAVVVRHVWECAEQEHGLRNQVIEVESVRCLQSTGVAAEDLEELHLGGVVEVGIA